MGQTVYPVPDVEIDSPVPVADGGTGAVSTADARNNLHVFGNDGVWLDSFSLNAGNLSSPGQALILGQGGSVTNVVADGVRWDSRTTTTSAGATAGVYAYQAGNLMFDTALPWTIWFQFRLDSALANYNIYFGVSTALQNAASATVNVNSLVGRFLQGTDTKFTAIGRAASGGQSAGATFGADVAVSTAYTARMRNVPGSGCYFGVQTGLDIFGDFGTEALVTTLPASGTSLGWQCLGGAFGAGTARTFLWRRTVIRLDS